jgi:hypothetical protein
MSTTVHRRRRDVSREGKVGDESKALLGDKRVGLNGNVCPESLKRPVFRGAISADQYRQERGPRDRTTFPNKPATC